MKTHQFTKSGLVAGGILLATAFAASDTLIENIRTAGRVASETGCAAQALTGGTVQLFDCSTVNESPVDTGRVSGD